MMEMSPIHAALEKVRARFVAALPTRVVALTELLSQVENDCVSRTRLDEAQFHLHQMAGTAQTLGFQELGQAACRCEELILDLGAKSSRVVNLATDLRSVLQLMAQAQG